jgi:hypothetical protein
LNVGSLCYQRRLKFACQIADLDGRIAANFPTI